MTDNGSILVECNLTQFPSRFTWHCYHIWTDDSVHLDGYVVREGLMETDELGIIATLDRGFGEYDFNPLNVRIAASYVWSEGTVLIGPTEDCGATTLLLPVKTLNVAVVTEALRRYGLSQGW